MVFVVVAMAAEFTVSEPFVKPDSRLIVSAHFKAHE
jgi:hypothetical protein